MKVLPLSKVSVILVKKKCQEPTKTQWTMHLMLKIIYVLLHHLLQSSKLPQEATSAQELCFQNFINFMVSMALQLQA